MGLASWFRNQMRGDSQEELILSPEQEMLSGLDLKHALDSHRKWKSRLEARLAGDQSHEIEVADVAQDSLCTLGKWLHGPAKKHYGHLPEYRSVRVAHANFHIVTAEVLIAHQSNDVSNAHELLKGPFRKASNVNQLELVKLFMAAKGQKAL